MSSPPSLTTHLLSLSPSALTRATTHPFLPLAATARLPRRDLHHWLAQDRLYALSYLTFVSTLLSHLPIDPGTTTSTSPGPDAAPTLTWRIASALIDCLTNIRTELALFESTAQAEGWWGDVVVAGGAGGAAGEAGIAPTSVTRAYADLFAGAAAAAGRGNGFLIGLTALWATEECYLRAWKFAAEHVPEDLSAGGKGGDVMQRVFIPNWTSAEFEGFVARLRGLVDEVAEGEERGGWVWRECEGTWKRVLEVEAEFWPKVEG